MILHDKKIVWDISQQARAERENGLYSQLAQGQLCDIAEDPGPVGTEGLLYDVIRSKWECVRKGPTRKKYSTHDGSLWPISEIREV